MPAVIAEVSAAYPGEALTVWAQDEHRIGLLPVIRRVWAPRGQRPLAPVHRRYRWLYANGFVQPATGANWWCLTATVSIADFQIALAQFAEMERIGPGRRAVLVVDRAGWHTSPRLIIPEGIHLAFLPPASPELQPAERLWPLLDEAAANRTFTDLDELSDVLSDRILTLEADRATIRAHTQYHWWPAEVLAALP